MEFSDSLPKASIQDLGVVLSGAGYEVYNKFLLTLEALRVAEFG